MNETAYAHDGECPRCASPDIEREVIYQTTHREVAGVVFFCGTCGLHTKVLASDREAWFDAHRSWQSPAVQAATYEEFAKRWKKRVGHAGYGDPEPLGPILPNVGGEASPLLDDDALASSHGEPETAPSRRPSTEPSILGDEESR